MKSTAGDCAAPIASTSPAPIHEVTVRDETCDTCQHHIDKHVERGSCATFDGGELCPCLMFFRERGPVHPTTFSNWVHNGLRWRIAQRDRVQRMTPMHRIIHDTYRHLWDRVDQTILGSALGSIGGSLGGLLGGGFAHGGLLPGVSMIRGRAFAYALRDTAATARPARQRTATPDMRRKAAVLEELGRPVTAAEFGRALREADDPSRLSRLPATTPWWDERSGRQTLRQLAMFGFARKTRDGSRWEVMPSWARRKRRVDEPEVVFPLFRNRQGRLSIKTPEESAP